VAKVTKQKISKKVSKKSSSDNPFLSGIQDISMPTGGIKMVVYGRSGSGKTTFACTFPKKLLLARCGLDDGTLSVYDVEGVQTSPLIKRPEELDMIIKMQKEDQPWKTIVLDTASEYQNVILADVIGAEQVPTQLSWGVARREQWGDVASGMKDKLRNLLNLADTCGTNIIILAQERGGDSEEANDELLIPSVSEALTPSVTGWLNPACDYVFHSFLRRKYKTIEKKSQTNKDKIIKKKVPTDEFEYCVRISTHNVYTTKFRKPKGAEIPEVIIDPSYEKFQKVREAARKV